MRKSFFAMLALLTCAAGIRAQVPNDNVLHLTFTGAGTPIESEHTLLGSRITFSEDGRQMKLTTNGATVTYNLSNVSGMSHFRGTPTVSLHANEDPDHAGNFYTTFYSGLEAYTLPEGVKAYTAEVAGESVNLSPIDGNVLPQGEAVLLFSSQVDNGNWTMTVADPSSASASDGNAFSGVDAVTSQNGSSNCYMLSYGQNKLGFYKMNADMPLSPNKAFLTTSASVKAIRMVFEDMPFGTTGLENIKETGDGADIYNLQGIRQNRLQKGINIVGDKKIVVK